MTAQTRTLRNWATLSPIGIIFVLLLALGKSDWALADLSTSIHGHLREFRIDYANPNRPAPQLGEVVTEAKTEMERRLRGIGQKENPSDLALRALLTQVTNSLHHVGLTFENGDSDYTHRDLFIGRYPEAPTLLALQSAADLLDFVDGPPIAGALERFAENKDKEAELLREQNRIAKEIANNPLENYRKFRQRLKENGNQARFPEFESMVQYLLLKLTSDATLLKTISEIPFLRKYHALVVNKLREVHDKAFPYMATINAVERTMQFYDVYQRSQDPERSPTLYHSGRYEYYLHFLKATAPDQVLFPTLASIGATDLIRTRGVPISFAGINTEISYVDGYFQTSYEFYIHDINHSRRMYLFFEKAATRFKMTIDDLAEFSDKFIRDILAPLFTVKPSDSREERNIKRLVKILLFEVVHEDALAAHPTIIEEALLRNAGFRTPFEEMNGDKVTYLMEPGATTLAYAFRKLVHDFYDMPGDRLDYIVEPEFRTYPYVAKAAMRLFKGLGVGVEESKVMALLQNDEGFPEDFRNQLLRDGFKRPDQTAPLISSDRALSLAIDHLLKSGGDQIAIDPSRTVEVVNFLRGGAGISVHLRIPVKDERRTVEVLVPVPEEQYAINAKTGTLKQLREGKRVLQITSGPYLSMTTFENQFLARLDPSKYLIAVRSDDSQASAIVAQARNHGIETLMVTDVSQPQATTGASPTLFATVSDDRELKSYWRGLKGRVIEFNKGPTNYEDLLKQMERERLHNQQTLQSIAVEKGVRYVPSENLANVVPGKVPIMFLCDPRASGPGSRIREIISSIMSMLDPKTLIVSDGKNPFIKEEASRHGLSVLSLVSENSVSNSDSSSDAILSGSDLISDVAVGDAGVARPALEFVKQRGGSAIFFDDRGNSAEAISLAVVLGTNFAYFSKGTTKTRQTTQKNLGRGFTNSLELLGLLYDNPRVVKEHHKRAARDQRFFRFSRSLESQGSTIVSYKGLLDAARGYKVVVINGYVGLGYEHPEQVKAALEEVMKREGDGVLYVGVGTHEGIGYAHEWIPEIARKLGFSNIKTSAVVSRNVADERLAPADFYHFVNNDVLNWRPMLGDKDLQVSLLQDTKGKLVSFRGGYLTGLVAQEALDAGLEVELWTGDALAPNRLQLARAVSARHDTVVDGTAELVKRKNASPTAFPRLRVRTVSLKGSKLKSGRLSCAAAVIRERP